MYMYMHMYMYMSLLTDWVCMHVHVMHFHNYICSQPHVFRLLSFHSPFKSTPVIPWRFSPKWACFDS